VQGVSFMVSSEIVTDFRQGAGPDDRAKAQLVAKAVEGRGVESA
jgi:hypothetical protein